MDDGVMEELLQLLVLKYVQNKDVFMRYHKAHLSRRLILEMSADQDKEEQTVNRLRVRRVLVYLDRMHRRCSRLKGVS